MSRDYKKRAPRRRTRKPRAPSPLGYLAAGFGLGIVAAVVVYKLFGPAPPPNFAFPEAAIEPQSAIEQPEPAESPARRPTRAPAVVDERFEFYEMLPNFEVLVADSDDKSEPAAAGKIDRPGAYVLQAGSFRSFDDADRMKATLALMGMEAQIQKVMIDNDQVWHRVRVGPMTDLTQVNRLRTQLREDNIDALLLRVATRPQ